MNNQALVVKHNSIVEARYKLSLMEQKIIIYLISLIRPDDEDFQLYQISIKDFLLITGVSTNNYGMIEDIATKLMKRVLKIRESDGTLTIYNWTSRCRIIPKKGLLEFRFDPDLKSYFLHLKQQFTQYQLHNILYLRSGYSIRIYELLKQYEKIGKRYFELDDLRSIVLGEDCNLYSRYIHFKQRVLEPSKEELSNNTDIKFEYEIVKLGKKVAGIEFIIKRNENYKKVDITAGPPTQAPSKKQSELRKRLQKYSISNIEEYLTKYPEDYIEEKINLAEKSKSKAKTKSFNIAGFFVQAVENDWKDTGNTSEGKVSNEHEDKFIKRENAKNLTKKLFTEFESIFIKKSEDILSSLSADDQLAFKRKYWNQNQNSELIRNLIDNPDDPDHNGNNFGEQIYKKWLYSELGLDIEIQFKEWVTQKGYKIHFENGNEKDILVFK